MKTPPEYRYVRLDLIKLLCLFLALAAPFLVVSAAPSLTTPTLLSIVLSLLLAPIVTRFERLGLSRGAAVGSVFGGIVALCVGAGFWAAQTLIAEWDSFKVKAPAYFHSAVDRLGAFEEGLKAKYAFLSSINLTSSVTHFGDDTAQWFLANGPAFMGSLATCLLVVPLFTFVLLKDGRTIRKKFFEFVPNRFFEKSFLISTKIITAVSDYLRAKLIEGLMVGTLTTVGLLIVHAPYAIVLGVIAGATNVVPYLGPVVGFVPALLVVLSEPSNAPLVWPVVTVYVVANVIDNVVIFPVFVAKLVNLHPAILIPAVMLGQTYYGMVGMLISIPVATVLKVILTEIFSAVYDRGSGRRTSVPV